MEIHNAGGEHLWWLDGCDAEHPRCNVSTGGWGGNLTLNLRAQIPGVHDHHAPSA